MARVSYYLLPYNDTGAKAFADAVVKKKNEMDWVRKHRLVTDLAGVGDSERLYVILHGGAGTLGWEEDTEVEVEETFYGTTTTLKKKETTTHQISVEALAKKLVNDLYMPDKSFELRLWACHSGEVRNGHEAVAGQLKSWLKKLGRKKVTV